MPVGVGGLGDAIVEISAKETLDVDFPRPPLVMLNHVETKGTPKATSASPSEKADSPKAHVRHRNGISDGMKWKDC